MKGKKVGVIIGILIIVIAVGVFAYVQLLAKNSDDGTEAALKYFETGDYLVTNLSDESTLVKLTVVLGVSKDVDETELANNTAVIRDRIIYVMRGHSKEDFKEQSSMDALSQELCQAINTELGVDYVQRAYFYDFVIQ